MRDYNADNDKPEINRQRRKSNNNNQKRNKDRIKEIREIDRKKPELINPTQVFYFNHGFLH